MMLIPLVIGTAALHMWHSVSCAYSAAGFIFMLWRLTQHACAGLLGFPKKDLQYRFLSSFKPVYYIRPRDYSKVG